MANGGTWVKSSSNPLITYLDSIPGYWGVGQPSAVNVNGTIWLFYTVGDSSGTRIQYKTFNPSNPFSFLSFGMVTTKGLKNIQGTADWLHNADFAYIPENDSFLIIRDKQFNNTQISADPSADVCSAVEMAVIPKSGINTGTWTAIGVVDQSVSGFPGNHNAGIVRDKLGIVSLPNLNFVFTVSCAGASCGNKLPEWSYKLYQISVIVPTYTVSYNDNISTVGTAPVDSNKYITGFPVTVSGNTGGLYKTDYTFTGWNTLANGTGTAYIPGDTFTMGSANVILYAKWTLGHSVTYKDNVSTGGAVPVDNRVYHVNDSVTVLLTPGNLTKTGYVFTGWNTLANGTGTTYIPGDTFTMGSADVTLYAKWLPGYTVTYKDNGSTGGTVPIDNNIYRAGGYALISGNTGNLTKTGYSFVGWNTSPSLMYAYPSSLLIVDSRSSFNTLYAIWAQNKYNVIYSGNINTGGTVPADSNKYIAGSIVTV